MTSEKGFYGLGIAPGILNMLERLGFKTPTPIQERSIPLAIEGKDLVGIAQTGTGKTLAFGIPMIQHVLKGRDRGLVVLPTRELAIQVHEVLGKIGAPLGFRSAIVIGGEAIGRQIRELRRKPNVVIGTPGRIIDHLEQKTLTLSDVKILVLDEADRMLDMGFAPQLKRILAAVPKERQTMLFSATMPDEIIQMARSYMQLPMRVEIAPPGTAVREVTQELFMLSRDQKPRLLEKLLHEYRGSVLVFTRTKFIAKRITRSVRTLGHTVAELHSNRSLAQRREAMEGFKTGRYRVLVATDIAARGIDVKGIELVLNYDLPSAPEDYIHRIGRTARAGVKGHAITFATPDQMREVRSIERLIRTSLATSKLPDLPPARQTETFPEHEAGRERRFGPPARGRAPFHGNRAVRSPAAPHRGGPASPNHGFRRSSFGPRRQKRFGGHGRFGPQGR